MVEAILLARFLWVECDFFDDETALRDFLADGERAPSWAATASDMVDTRLFVVCHRVNSDRPLNLISILKLRLHVFEIIVGCCTTLEIRSLEKTTRVQRTAPQSF